MKHLNKAIIGAAAVALAGCAGMGMQAKEDMAPFGGADSIAYADELWSALEDARMVGDGRIVSRPYKGLHPHGAVLDTMESTLKVGGHTGELWVKNNYGGDGVSIAAVTNDPDKYLAAVTVMYRREAGYDADNQDWFWAKYLPDGTLDKNPAGMQLAGRVAKGKPAGCIACHKAAPGGDLRFLKD